MGYASNLSPLAIARSLSRAESAHRRIPAPLLAGVLAYLAAYLAWHVFGSDHRKLIGDFAFLPLTALAALVAWRAGERATGIRGLRWGWRLIALALISYGIGDVIQLYYEVGGGTDPSPSPDDLFYLGFYPLFLAGILRFPWGRAGNRGLRRLAFLDALTIAIGGAALVWYVVLGPTAYSDSGSLFGNLVAVAYPAGDLVLIAALARLCMGTSELRIHRSIGLLAIGITLYVAADVLYSWAVLNSGYAGGGWLDTLWLFATASFVFAAASQPDLDAPGERGTEEEERLSPWMAALPYLAVLLIFGLLIGAQDNDAFFPGLSLTLTAALVAALVLLRQFLSQRNLASANSELRKAQAELAALATTDPLTALPNHRALDVDSFKALNDSRGHAAGDGALRELGAVMRRALRSIDTLGRWGGEEFVIVLSEIDAEAAMVTAERIRAIVAEHLFDFASGAHLTLSIGAATYPQDGSERNELLEAADCAMYMAKRMGHNQVANAC